MNILIAILAALAIYAAFILGKDSARRNAKAPRSKSPQVANSPIRVPESTDNGQYQTSAVEAPPMFKRIGKNTRNIKKGKVYELKAFESDEPYIMNERMKKSHILFRAGASWKPFNDSARNLLQK